MIFVINRALGLLNGGAENFDLGMINNVFNDPSELCIYCGEKKSVQPLLDPRVKTVSPKMPFLRLLSYRFQRSKYISAFFYTLDNLIFETHFILFFLLKHKKTKGSENNIIYCCSLFLIPIFLAPFYKSYTFVSWLPGPPGNFAQKQLRILNNYPNFRLFTRGFPENTLLGMGFQNEVDFFIVPPALKQFWLDGAKQRQKKRVSKNQIVGVTTARLVPIKDLDFLLNCLSFCAAKGLNFKWTIIGDGPEKEFLEAKLKDYNLQKLVKFSGELPHDAVQDMLFAADVFALSSQFENYSNAVLESFACGVPCILRDVGYMPNLIGDKLRGLLFSSPENFYIALKHLVLDENTYRATSYECIEFAQKHNWLSISQIFWRNIK